MAITNYQSSFIPYVSPEMAYLGNIFNNVGQGFKGQGVPTGGLLQTAPSMFNYVPHIQRPFNYNPDLIYETTIEGKPVTIYEGGDSGSWTPDYTSFTDFSGDVKSGSVRSGQEAVHPPQWAGYQAGIDGLLAGEGTTGFQTPAYTGLAPGQIGSPYGWGWGTFDQPAYGFLEFTTPYDVVDEFGNPATNDPGGYVTDSMGNPVSTPVSGGSLGYGTGGEAYSGASSDGYDDGGWGGSEGSFGGDGQTGAGWG